MADIGDTTYRGASVWLRLPGNTTTTRKFLRQTGNGTSAAAPAWDTITDTDIASALSNTTSAHNALSNVVSNIISAGGGGVSVTSNELSVAAAALSNAVSALSASHTSLVNRVSANSATGGSGSVTSDELSAVSAQAASALSQAVSVLSQSLSVTNAAVSNLTSAHNALSNAVSALSVGGGGGDTYVVKTANEIVSASIVLQNDDHLFFSATTSAMYQFDLVCYMQATSTIADWKLFWTVPAGATMLWGAFGDGATTWNAGAASPAALDTEATSVIVQSGNSIHGHLFKGKVATAGTGGNVQLQWAQGASVAADNTMLAGSHIKYRRLI